MKNDMPYKTIGIGSIKIRMHDNIVRMLTNVQHVSELKKNLISWRKLEDMVLIKEKKLNTLYILKVVH